MSNEAVFAVFKACVILLLAVTIGWLIIQIIKNEPADDD
jgi:hypothetical protein